MVLKIMNFDKLWIWCDGSSLGNPGFSGLGVIARDSDGKIVFQEKEKIGERTSNEAELEAVILGLENARNLTNQIRLYTDSKLAIKAMNEEWNIKAKNLSPLIKRIKLIESAFEEVRWKQIPKKKNKEADALANVAIRIKEKKDMSELE